MQPKKIILLIFIAVTTVLLPLVLLLTNLQLTAFDRSYYQNEFIKYNIPQTVGIDIKELMKSTEKLLLYMENKRGDLDFEAEINGQQVEFFSTGDKIHMIDVKNLFIRGRILRNIALIFIVGFTGFLIFRRRNDVRLFAKLGFAVFFTGSIPVLILIALINIDFNKYFTVFHEIFFNNNYWLMNPSVDRLVNIFPQEFFSDIALKVAYLYTAEMGAILLLSIIGSIRARKI